MIVRRNNSHPINRLRDEMESLFSNAFGGMPMVPFLNAGQRAFPALNLWEDQNSLFVEAEVPGLTMGDLEVVVVNDELTLRGQRREAQAEGETFHRRERGVGEFSRVIRLPADIEVDKVQATLRDGVLTINLPKAAAARPRKIEVRAE